MRYSGTYFSLDVAIKNLYIPYNFSYFRVVLNARPPSCVFPLGALGGGPNSITPKFHEDKHLHCQSLSCILFCFMCQQNHLFHENQQCFLNFGICPHAVLGAHVLRLSEATVTIYFRKYFMSYSIPVKFIF